MENKNKIGAWKKTLASGKEVISFTIEGKKYDMWVNEYKKEEKHPDFQIVPNEYKPKAETKKEYAVNQQEHESHPTDLPF
jgi:hypothetical protein